MVNTGQGRLSCSLLDLRTGTKPGIHSEKESDLNLSYRQLSGYSNTLLENLVHVAVTGDPERLRIPSCCPGHMSHQRETFSSFLSIKSRKFKLQTSLHFQDDSFLFYDKVPSLPNTVSFIKKVSII